MTDDGGDDLYRLFGLGPEPEQPKPPQPEPESVESPEQIDELPQPEPEPEPVDVDAAVLAAAAAVVDAEGLPWEEIAADFGDDGLPLLAWIRKELPADILVGRTPAEVRQVLACARFCAVRPPHDFARLMARWTPEQRAEAVWLGSRAWGRLSAEMLAAADLLGMAHGRAAHAAGPKTTWRFIEAARLRREADAAAQAKSADREEAAREEAEAAARLAAEQDALIRHYAPVIRLVTTRAGLDRWYDLMAAAGLVAATETTIDNPDLTKTLERTETAPEVTSLSITRDSLAIEIRPLLGQTLAAVERGCAALGMALGYPNMAAEQGRPGYVVLRTRDRKVALGAMVWRSRRDLPTGVTTREDAAARVDDIRLPIGVLADGTHYETPPLPRACHTVVAGSIGSGKSVWVAETVAYLAGVGATGAGAEVYVLDGKGSDYAGARPYVASVAAQTWSHVVMLRHVYDVMLARTARADELITSGMTTEAAYATFPPIVLVIDEWGATRARMAKSIGKSRADKAMQYLDEIIRVGRQPRVWVILASQTMYDKDVPNVWQENLPNRLVIGQPEPMSIQKVFDRNAESAQELSASIEKTMKGRAIVQTSPSSVALVQTFYDYAPGRDWSSCPDKESWKIQRESLESPRLYPRRAPDLDALRVGASPTADLATLVADFVSQGTQDDWAEMRMVTLDRRGPDGQYAPDPARVHLDPTHPSYVGRVQSRINLDED